MSRTVWVGAVAYDPKVVIIWEGMRRYFHEEARLSVEVILFQSYEAQVSALLAPLGERVPYIDIAWNTNLAYLQADAWSGQRCRPIAMRDTDIGWMTKIVAATGGPLATLADLRGRTLALAVATAATLRFYRYTSLREEVCKKERTIARYASTAISVSTAIPAPVKWRSFALFSTVAPTPGQSVVRSGKQCKSSALCRKARSPKSGPHHLIITACSRLDPILIRCCSSGLPKRCPG